MVGKRFGGQHSTGGATGSAPGASRWDARPVRRGSKGAKLLYVAPIPLFFAGLGEVMQGDPLGILAELGGFAALMAGAWFVNEGVKAEQAFEARSVAKPPRFPRKLFGGVVIGAGVGFAAAFGWGIGILSGAVLGGLALSTSVLAFELDPMRAKGLEAHSEFDRERVANAVDRAEGLLDELLEAANRIRDRALIGRVERLAAAARDVIRAVEDDPRDLPRARKFLGLYLTGARDATIKFADIWTRSRDAQARADYECLLDDLETSFRAHREKLMIEDRSDLDIEIDVLRHRLQQEGLMPLKEE
ncbi:hypothetical protein FHS89_002020 [Rubricella aquisinus]|uniref:5-bromo-4-chloroindolyl phosphate hydrolysis protein n=1 Tax=Rubricella aquisinus TaxID=2028108 RepID=A0A840WXV5_9RHOB|nr:5-bromo-4-chloroindolyl phosphate hydrolysis family protein [Rubricella aquisinus]MBB5516000.1 hypothetical protein [Rubricella aquisinus]